MRSLRLEKRGLRGLAIAESFGQNSTKSVFSGVVMRLDLTIDGFVIGSATVGEGDATETIMDMYDRLQRPDVSYVLISGMILSMYNIVDIKGLHAALGIPVIGVSYRDSEGLEDAIKRHFPNSFEGKISEYARLGRRERITLDTSHDVFVRREGCTASDARRLLNKLTLHGSVPEPIRVSRLLANALLKKQMSQGD